MSLYQPVGDTLALTVLAYQLYRKGYQVARHAPDSFRELLDELRVFKRTLWQVQKSLKQSSEDLGEDVVAICANVLQKDFQPLVAKYEKLAYAERGQQWVRRFQFAADREAISSAYSKLNQAQNALQSWLTLDTRETCNQIFEALKREFEVQHHGRQGSVAYSPLETVTKGGSAERGSGRSFSDKVDSLIASDHGQNSAGNIPLRSPTYTPRRSPPLPNHLRRDSLGVRESLTNFLRVDTGNVSQSGLAISRQTSINTNSPIDNQSETGAVFSSDTTSDVSRPEQNSLFSTTGQKTSTIDEKFFRQFVRECVPRPELEEAFEASAKEDVDPETDVETWIYRAVWWTLKAHKIWNVLHDHRTIPSSSLSSTEWMTENITMEQTVVDLLKADYILHNVVLERLQVGESITWALSRRLSELSTAIRHGIVRNPKGASLDTSVLLKQRTSLAEMFVQPLEQEDAMPDALDTLDASSRFLEWDEETAGSHGERVLFRTFVNAQIGDKDVARKSPNAPYLLVLWMQKYGADFELSLLNQYGSLSLNLSITREEVLNYDEELTASGSDLRLDFPGQKAIIKFLSNANADDFIARPRSFFKHVKDRYPRKNELLVFRTGLHSSQGPSRVKQRTRSENDPGQPSRPCEISLYNHIPSKLWKMTRRLVLCSMPSKRSVPQPFSQSIWLPLDHVRVSVSSREVKVLWSDCGHLERNNLGDYREEYSYVYKANEPNQELHLVFKSDSLAVEFARHILLPFETGLRLEEQFRNATTINSEHTVRRETRVVVLRDLDAPENLGYFALVSTQRSSNSHSYSTIHFAYAENDIKVDTDDGASASVTLMRLRKPTYHSEFTNLIAVDPAISLDQVSACKTIRDVGCGQVFHFDSSKELRMFLLALTDWTILFSRRVEGIHLGGRFPFPMSTKNSGEVQLWAQPRVGSLSGPPIVRIVIRIDGRDGEGARYLTTSLAGPGDLAQTKPTRVTVKPPQGLLQQGSLLEMRRICASVDRKQEANLDTYSEASSPRHSKLAIDFHHNQHVLEMLGEAHPILFSQGRPRRPSEFSGT